MFSLFRHNQPSPVTCQLRIEGIATAPMTPEPDEAEKAATALLASLCSQQAKNEKMKKCKNEKGRQPAKGTAEYYKQLAERIKEKQAEEARAAMRYVAYCEEQLKQLSIVNAEGVASWKRERSGNSQLSILNSGLFKHQDAVEREGGELKHRWQHCLANVTIRLMDNSQLTIDNEALASGGSTDGAENPEDDSYSSKR